MRSWRWPTAFVVLGALGWLLPLWPLSALAILLLAFSGRWLTAILLGLALDLLWGAPLGWAEILAIPFTLVAVFSSLVRAFASEYFIDRRPPERL